ncbi:aminotransferase class V-fold PLP-dependent enzyme [Pedobacter aquatilis]|uniref:aminotransferase class V-fold PLP-dependent enzyme n=1 Tax=Pedobacter aquatilis TaxID=351343 RepID=UPI00292EA7E6|nr:aminotransferase class V-fold PLP-dependent enzyme [Pedobacter aquatilis]
MELNTEEVQKIRAETTGCSKIIHFNNAGASLPADVVNRTVIDYLLEEASFGGYETEAKHAACLSAVYTSVAKLLNASQEEIALFENASAAWATAFNGIEFSPGDEVLISEMEYVTNLIGFSSLKEKGVLLKVIPNDKDGNFSVSELKAAINEKTKLIAVTHISSSGGAVVPIEAIGNIAEEHNIMYLVDACQSAGQMPLDVKKIKCNILSATGRKYLRAPRGTGFLFVKKDSLNKIKPYLLDFLAAGNVSMSGFTLREDARRFELYEKSRALTLGLGKAVDYALEIGLENIWARISTLSKYLRVELIKIPGLILHDKGEDLSGIVTFFIAGEDSLQIKSLLLEKNMNVSTGGQQATPLYMNNQNLKVILRASVHYYNTKKEIEEFCMALSRIVKDI